MSEQVIFFKLKPFYGQFFSPIIEQFELFEIISLEEWHDLEAKLKTHPKSKVVIEAPVEIKKFQEEIKKLDVVWSNVNLLIISLSDATKFDLNQLPIKPKNVTHFVNDLSLARRFSIIFDWINQETEMKKVKDQHYLALDLPLLLPLTKSPSDIYIRLGVNKFIKIIAKDDDFKVQDIIRNFTDKNITTFFISYNELTKFKDSSIAQTFKHKESIKDNIELQIGITESALIIAKNFGVNDFVIEGSNEVFEEIRKDFLGSNKLKNLLQSLKGLQNGIIGTHCYLTSIFIGLIGANFNWYTKEVKKNLYLSSLLHDLELLDSGMEEFEFVGLDTINQLDPKKRDLIKNHSNELAKKLSKNDSIPSDVVTIVSKHHEGSGPLSYPQGLYSTPLSPTICLFIVAHQFSIELFKINYAESELEKAINSTKTFLSSNSFKPFLDALENELKK